MMIRVVLCAAIAAALGCPAPPRPPAVTPGATPGGTVSDDAMPVIEWAKRDPAAVLVPPAARRIELVLTPGAGKGDQYGWLFAEASVLFAVFHFEGNAASELIAKVGEIERATRAFSFMVLSDDGQTPPRQAQARTAPPPFVLAAPPPPPPPPGGTTTNPLCPPPLRCQGSPLGGGTPTGGGPAGKPPWDAALLCDVVLQFRALQLRANVGAGIGGLKESGGAIR